MDWTADLTHSLQALWTDTDRLQLGYAFLLGGSTFILTLGLFFVAAGIRNPLRKRVQEVSPVPLGAAAKDAPRRGLLSILGGVLLPRAAAKRRHKEELLNYANLRTEGTLRAFYGAKLSAMVLAPAAVLLALSFWRAAPVRDQLQYVACAALAGYLVPDLVITRLARRRQDRLRRGLPDAMDLLVVCSEAGLGLSAGIARVAAEVALSHPELADELALFSMHTRAGMDNRAALKDLAERTGLEDIQTLVAMLLQSMRFGTGIADTLRICADELRDKRLQRAQEKAARVSTLLLFPLILCVLPSFFLVVLGPPILGAIESLSHSGLFN